jgi:ferritin-like metal-binding protein YciE
MPKMEGLQQLLVDELQDLFDAEKQLVKALPKMAKTASDEELANAFREHLEVTKGQVARLEQVFDSMEMRAKSKPCHGMKGLVEEAQEMMEEDHEEMVLDAGLIGAARRVEHYEMAAYESARALAQQLGMKDAAQLLQETMREEMETDKLLGTISKRLLKEAGRMKPAGQEEGGGRSQSRGKSQGGGKSQGCGRSGGNSRSRGSQRSGGGSAEPLTDHERIREWAEERGGTPACVRGTGGKGDIGMLRIDFPGYSGEDSLEPISWDDWFEKFDERGLALIVQEKTGRGQKSNFNKLISRESAEERKPKAKAAR